MSNLEKLFNLCTDYTKDKERTKLHFGVQINYCTEVSEELFRIFIVDTTCVPPFEDMRIVKDFEDPTIEGAAEKAVDWLELVKDDFAAYYKDENKFSY